MAFDQSKPAGSTKIRLSDEEIRANWTALETALGQDHDFTTGSTQTGKHQVVTLDDQGGYASNPSGNTLLLYNNSGTSYLHDSGGNKEEIRNLSLIPSGTRMFFYQDSAPTGWTLDTSMNDKLLFVTKGSGAGGETGGSAHSSGTWTQPNHTHSYSGTTSQPSHTNIYNRTGADIVPHDNHTHTYSGTTGGGATANTWRPACYCVIAASKD